MSRPVLQPAAGLPACIGLDLSHCCSDCYYCCCCCCCCCCWYRVLHSRPGSLAAAAAASTQPAGPPFSLPHLPAFTTTQPATPHRLSSSTIILLLISSQSSPASVLHGMSFSISSYRHLSSSAKALQPTPYCISSGHKAGKPVATFHHK